MFPICQRYTFEANHNKLLNCFFVDLDVSNMSKIHFRSKSQQSRALERSISDVSNMSKIHFRSKSQPDGDIGSVNLRCFQYVKDTLSKQITTSGLYGTARLAMFPICQRYKSRLISIIHSIFLWQHTYFSSAKVSFVF